MPFEYIYPTASHMTIIAFVQSEKCGKWTEDLMSKAEMLHVHQSAFTSTAVLPIWGVDIRVEVDFQEQAKAVDR